MRRIVRVGRLPVFKVAVLTVVLQVITRKESLTYRNTTSLYIYISIHMYALHGVAPYSYVVSATKLSHMQLRR